MVSRRVAAPVVGVVCAVATLTGCFRSVYVDDPTPRPPATPVAYSTRVPHCPAGTVLLRDDEPGSGAGSIPTGFDAQVLVWCYVDHSTMRVVRKAERFTVSEIRRTVTTELLRSLHLPDRRGDSGCAGASPGTVAVYLADDERQLIRVDLPQDPCSIRTEVVAELPGHDTAPDRTFTADRPRR